MNIQDGSAAVAAAAEGKSKCASSLREMVHAVVETTAASSTVQAPHHHKAMDSHSSSSSHHFSSSSHHFSSSNNNLKQHISNRLLVNEGCRAQTQAQTRLLGVVVCLLSKITSSSSNSSNGEVGGGVYRRRCSPLSSRCVAIRANCLKYTGRCGGKEGLVFICLIVYSNQMLCN